MDNQQETKKAPLANGALVESCRLSARRVQEVKEKLAFLDDTQVSSSYLDKLASYILEPINKEEKQKVIITENIKQNISKRETSFESIISQYEYGEDAIYSRITNDKRIIFNPKDLISEKDLQEIPGLRELVETTKNLEAQAKAATGKRKFLLKKQVIQMYKDQYVMKQQFRQPIYSRNAIRTLAKLDLGGKDYLAEDGITVASAAPINLFTQSHIVALLNNYSQLKMETWDSFNSDMRWLLLDFENLVDSALKDEFPLYYELVKLKIDGRTNAEIQSTINDIFGKTYTEEYLSSLWRNKIPKLIAETAQREWLLYHFTFEERGNWKHCNKCDEYKPAHPLFFNRNANSRDGFYSVCKKCRAAARKKEVK